MPIVIKWKRLDAAPPVRDLASVVHYNQRYAFVSSARLDFQAGTGLSPVVLDLMAALARKGKKIALVAPPPLRLPPSLLRAWFNYRVSGTLGELETDVVVGFAGDGYRFARSKRRCRFVAFLPEVTADQFAASAGGRRLAVVGRARRERIASRACDLVVVTSEYARRRIADAYELAAPRVAVVPCGVDPDEWNERTLPEHDRPRILSVVAGAGPLELSWVLGGFALAREAGVEAELHLAGTDHETMRMHSDLVRRCGIAVTCARSRDLRRSALKAEFGACDLYVQASARAGGAPHVLWAMATGRPVIAPAAADLPELVGSGGNQVPFGDQEGLGRAMADVLGDKKRHRQLAANARRRALERSWGASASRFGELLSEL